MSGSTAATRDGTPRQIIAEDVVVEQHAAAVRLEAGNMRAGTGCSRQGWWSSPEPRRGLERRWPRCAPARVPRSLRVDHQRCEKDVAAREIVPR